MPVDKVIAEAQAELEKLWKKRETQTAKDDESAPRRRMLRDMAARMFPPAWLVPRAEIVKRIEDERLFKVAHNWQWGDGNVLFAGRTGAGKTAAACYLLRRLLVEGADAGGDAWEQAQYTRIQSARELSEAMRPARGESPEASACRRATLLVLDDLGLDALPAHVGAILDYRYNHLRPTLTTTGLTLDQIVGHFGEAVSRRLMELGDRRGTAVHCFTPEPPTRRPHPEGK